MLESVPLICTSATGTVYDVWNFTDVSHGVVTVQNGLSSALSGSFARTSHELVLVRPVLVPPWTKNRSLRREDTLKSTPFQCSVCLPKFFARVTKLSTAPTVFRS